MTLVYRSVFTDADGAISAALRREFEEWLASKKLKIPEAGLGRRGSALMSPEGDVAWASEHRTTLPTGDELHRLRLVEDNPGERWTTSAVAILPSGTGPTRSRARIWVDVEHEPAAGSPPKRPGSPRLVRELIGVGEAFDGPVPLTSDAWIVHGSQIDEVSSWISSQSRSVPVVVFAHDAKREYDQADLSRRLARDLSGVATVLRLRDAEANERLARRLPAEYAVWAGAMRTYLPGIGDENDVPSRHRVLGRTSLVALGQRAFPAVKDQILGLSVSQPAPVVPDATKLTVIRPSVRRLAPVGPPPVGPGWLRQRLMRMRRVLGTDRESPAAGTPSETLTDFDHALEALIERASGVGPTPPGLVTASSRASAPVMEPGAEDRAEIQDQLQRERADREALEELLDELQGDLETKVATGMQLRVENDDLTLEATEAAEEADRLERQVRFLQRRVRELGDSGVGSDDTLPIAPPSVAEVIVLARDHLPYVHIGADVDPTAAELDLDGRAQLFAMKAWSALCALNAFAKARALGEFQGSFYGWCSEPPTGEPAIAANAVAMVESQTVGTAPQLREARTFPVPPEVNPDGRAYMEAHIKVVKRGTPAPRLHFLDDAAHSGKVYVGYLGQHLPTARFS